MEFVKSFGNSLNKFLKSRCGFQFITTKSLKAKEKINDELSEKLNAANLSLSELENMITEVFKIKDVSNNKTNLKKRCEDIYADSKRWTDSCVVIRNIGMLKNNITTTNPIANILELQNVTTDEYKNNTEVLNNLIKIKTSVNPEYIQICKGQSYGFVTKSHYNSIIKAKKEAESNYEELKNKVSNEILNLILNHTKIYISLN